MRRLHNKRGETLAETLCAVLVAGLALALLMGLTTASFRLDRKTDQALAALYTAVSNAESAPGSTSQGAGTLTVEFDGEPDPTKTVTFNVNFYGDSGQAMAYRKGA